MSNVFLPEDYGVHLPTTKTVSRPSHWAWFTIHSIANVYVYDLAQSFSVRPQEQPLTPNATHEANIARDGLTGAGIDTSFLTLDLASVFTKPSKNPDILTRHLLVGFAFLAATASTFIPVAGPLLATSTAATLSVVGEVGSVAGNAVSTGPGFLGLVISTG